MGRLKDITSMKKLGVMLTDLRGSQESYLAIEQMNRLVLETDIDCTIFTEFSRFKPCMTPLFGVMDFAEIWSFDGLLISTNLSNTNISINALNAAKKIFYVWDLEWLRGKKDFVENVNIYRSNKVELIARSNDHSIVLQNYTNRKPNRVIPQFNLKELINAYL